MKNITKIIFAISISLYVLIQTTASVSAFENTVNTLTSGYNISGSDVYPASETPTIKLETKSNFGQKIVKFISDIFSNSDEIVIKVKDSSENEVFTKTISSSQELITIDSINFTPGKFSVFVNDKLVADFYWGVLAINTDKSVYKTNEEAKIDIAVLDSIGQMICTANVKLEITDPNNETETLSTDNGKIIVNSNVCSLTELTLTPDYETKYITSTEGIYKMKLISEHQGTIWEIDDSFEVKDSNPISIKRISATRLYPINKYPMFIEVTANTDFEGKIIDTVPSKFNILNDDPMQTSNFGIENSQKFNNQSLEGEKKTITFEANIKSGETKTYHYFFEPSKKSPDLFLIGELKAVDDNNNQVFIDRRKWQMANDSTNVAEYYLNTSGNWTAPSGVTSVSVEAWGGGGGGAGATATTVYAQAGGGGGGYSKLNTYSVTPSSTYAYSAGAGGTRGTGAGGAGGDSNFINTSTLLAKGGTQGSGDTAGTGGASGSGVGDTKYTGGDGAAGTASAVAGGAGGGSAGTNGNGSAGSGATGGSAGTEGGVGAPSSGTTEQNGRGGQAPGGGGSGGYVPDDTDHSGGVGGPGQVKVSYTTANNSPTLVGVSAQVTGTGTSLSPTLPGGVASGDLILLYTVHRADVDPTYTITGYTRRSGQYYNVGTGDLDMEMWYKIAGSSESNPSITASTGTNGWSAQAIVYRGVDTANPFDTGSSTTNTNAAAETLAPTVASTSTDYALVISAVASYDDNNITLSTSNGFTSPMNYTSYTTTTGSDHSFALGYAVRPTTGTTRSATWRQALDTGTGASLTYDQWVYISDAIKPANNAVTTPSLDSPTDTATNQSLTPSLLTITTDLDSDYLRYKIELCENVGMSTNCQTFDQTSSQTGWSGQNAQTSTAYTSGTQAVYILQSALSTNSTYYWRSYAIDPAGTNTWSGTQTPRSFTTTNSPSSPSTPYAEGASNPTGITDLTPEFSAVHSDPDSDSAVYYEIEVNTASDFSGTVMWDTGQTSMSSLANSVRSTDVSYAGTALSYNGTTYYWRIRFTDNKGAVGAWSATQNFSTNSSSSTPSLDSPTDTATNQSISLSLSTTSTDTNSDYLRYKIELCENVGMSTNCQAFDQTSSQTGWSGQDAQTSTAYASGTQAIYAIQTPLANSQTYYWRSYSIDPGGSNTWSSTQGTPYSFATVSNLGPAFEFKGLNFGGINIE